MVFSDSPDGEVFDAAYYARQTARARAVLARTRQYLQQDELALIDELIEHNEFGLVIRMIIESLEASDVVLSEGQSTDLAELVEDIGGDAADRRRARIVTGQPEGNDLDAKYRPKSPFRA